MSGVLNDVKVGDKLLVTSRWTKRIVTVEKVLKANIIANGVKYRKSDGYEVPLDAWNIASARPVTDEDIESIKKENRRLKMASAIRQIDFDGLTNSQLEQILEIVSQKS